MDWKRGEFGRGRRRGARGCGPPPFIYATPNGFDLSGSGLYTGIPAPDVDLSTFKLFRIVVSDLVGIER